ncbi:MAG: SoxR reducing system RseC family protein, partial [Alistipes sp.]|nr:SoxR reducing system RseC family protein [Alistipes sp.]
AGGVKRRVGRLSVALAYGGARAVLRAVLLLTVGAADWAEGPGALAALGGVALYYMVLWLCRRKIEHTIQFTITKN